MRKLFLVFLTCVLGSLWTYLILAYNKGWKKHTYVFRYSWLEYTDSDPSPENQCNCSAILQGDSDAVEQAKILSITKDFQRTVHIPDEYYMNETHDCREFKRKRKYLTFPLSQEEEDFPLAYSMVVHHKVQNFERLLRAIYAPQNIYCVHVDKKAKSSIFLAIWGIVSCFPNVFLVSQREDVVYAAWPRVQADINCMADLYNSTTEWKYFINLCGQDFPLKTNLEMVRMLRSLGGGNSMESEPIPEGKKRRVQTVHQIINGEIRGTEQQKEPPPFNVTIMSGSAYIVVNRGYIRSVLEDERVEALFRWANDTYSPDEFLWATIQRMPGIHGSTRPHRKFDLSDLTAIARLVKWGDHEGPEDSAGAVYSECQGHHVRGICVLSVGDLKWMLTYHHLFANKFDVDTDPIAVYCLERYLRQRALSELQ